jgi:hypothetical protein
VSAHVDALVSLVGANRWLITELELYVGRHRDVPGQIETDRGPRIEEDLPVEFAIARAHGRSKLGRCLTK